MLKEIVTHAITMLYMLRIQSVKGETEMYCDLNINNQTAKALCEAHFQWGKSVFQNYSEATGTLNFPVFQALMNHTPCDSIPTGYERDACFIDVSAGANFAQGQAIGSQQIVPHHNSSTASDALVALAALMMLASIVFCLIKKRRNTFQEDLGDTNCRFAVWSKGRSGTQEPLVANDSFSLN